MYNRRPQVLILAAEQQFQTTNIRRTPVGTRSYYVSYVLWLGECQTEEYCLQVTKKTRLIDNLVEDYKYTCRLGIAVIGIFLFIPDVLISLHPFLKRRRLTVILCNRGVNL